MEADPMLTVSDVAKHLKVTEQYLSTWLRKGELQGPKWFGKQWDYTARGCREIYQRQ